MDLHVYFAGMGLSGSRAFDHSSHLDADSFPAVLGSEATGRCRSCFPVQFACSGVHGLHAGGLVRSLKKGESGEDREDREDRERGDFRLKMAGGVMPWVREWGHRVFCDCLRGFSCLLPDKSDFPVPRRRVCC